MASRSYDRPDVLSPVIGDYTKISGTGNPPDDTSSTAASFIQRGRYVGQTTPAYHRKLKRGELLPLNAYTRWDYVESRGPKLYTGTNKGPNPKYSYRETGPSSPVIGVHGGSLVTAFESLNRIARNVNVVALQQKAFADIAPDLDLLTTLAEVPKTVSMVLGVRKRALGLIKQALRGGFDTARAMSSAHLEWRYGWRILGYDIQNFCDYWNRPFRSEILQGFAGTSFSEEEQVTAHVVNLYCQYDNICDINRTLNVKVRAAVKYSGRNANVLVSPVTTSWELIPLSFVGDWFVSVGDVLSAWSVISQADRIASSAGYKWEENARMVRANQAIGSSAQAVSPFGSEGTSTSTGRLLARSPLGSPSLVPQLRVELTSARIADAVALLVGFNKAAGLR